MLGVKKSRQSLLLSVLSFILGCMVTTFFTKIDIARSSNSGSKLTFPQQSNVEQAHSSLSNLHPRDPNYLLVILILSSPYNLNSRNLLRSTWLQFCIDSNDVRYFFVIGTKDLHEEHHEELLSEHQENHDLMLLSDIIDSFDHLTNKVLNSLTWVDANVKNYQYVLKCDEDTFVDVNKVLFELKKMTLNSEGSNLYWGFFTGKNHVLKRGKWIETNWNLCDHYLPYAVGGGYVLSQQLVALISQNSQKLKIFKNEDMSVGVWLAPFNVNRKHDCRFDTEYKSRGCSNKYLVTHKQNEEEMRTLYTSLKQTGRLCDNEIMTRMSYVYNWNVPPSKCCDRVKYDLDIL